MVKVLGIESSCDETAVAVVDGDKPAGSRVLAALVKSQLSEHADFGGVVPEIAARAHIQVITPMVRQVMQNAGLGWADIDGVAATTGPGLIGGLVIGSTLGKSLALAANKPFIPINHLEGHVLSPQLIEEVEAPFLVLLVSGGHTQFVKVNGLGDYEMLGTTIDDAAGEAFDKVAKILGLGYPGGPAVEQLAKQGDPKSVELPRPLTGKKYKDHGCDFSFAGLKTAVLYAYKSGEYSKADIAASFQQAVADVLEDRTTAALKQAALKQTKGMTTLVVAGGVAANQKLRGVLEKVAKAHDIPFLAPPLKLCTDNAEMIAWAGVKRLESGQVNPLPAGLDFKARPRWPLTELGDIL